jgi:hypothetical protein
VTLREWLLDRLANGRSVVLNCDLYDKIGITDGAYIADNVFMASESPEGHVRIAPRKP